MNVRRLALNALVAAVSLLATECRADEPAADLMVGKKPGQVRDDNSLEMKLVWCPPGFVRMENVEVVQTIEEPEPVTQRDKSDDDYIIDEPPQARVIKKVTKVIQVKVLVARGYWIGQYEVTQSEWKQMMATEPWYGKEFTKEGDDFPATYIHWDGATEFCRRLTEQERKAGRLAEGWGYRLPTEAQWERACRAQTDTTFNFGEDQSKLSEHAWFDGNALKAGEQYAHRVGQKKPNPWGLFDMHGNVYEWCRDAYLVKLPGLREPRVTPNNPKRVFRGGAWVGQPDFCRSAYRDGFVTSDRSPGLGFRVAITRANEKSGQRDTH